MNFLVNPVMAGRILTQMGNFGSYIRGIARVSSEDFGMPQAVPNDRKIDYLWRDTFMPWANAYVMECTYRWAEKIYVMPQFMKFLELDKLGLKEVPKSLRGKMMGSIVSSRSYYMVPDLLETSDIPALQAKLKEAVQYSPKNRALHKEIKKEITATQDLAKHLRRIMNTPQYIDKHLNLSKEEARLLKKHLGRQERYFSLFNKLDESQVMSNVRKSLKGKNQQDSAKILKEASDNALQSLRRRLNMLAKHPATKNSTFIKKLASMNDVQLVRYIKGDSYKFTRNPIGWLRKFFKGPNYTPEQLVQEVNKHIIFPLFRHEKQVSPATANLFKELGASKLKMVKLAKVFEGSGFWLKLPISIIGVFLMYGLLANTFDAKFLQPYQRQLVKERGTSREMIAPAYLGIIPAAATFMLVSKLPFVQRLGYLGSFALTGFAALSAFVASTAFMFLTRIRGPVPEKFKNDMKKPAPVKPQPSPLGSFQMTAQNSPFKALQGQTQTRFVNV